MKVSPPQLPAVVDVIGMLTLADELVLETCKVQSGDFVGVVAKGISLDEVAFDRVLLSEAKLERLNVRDTIFKGCEFSAANCSDTSILRAVFSDGRMSGWDCNKGVCKDVVFKNCKLDLANFRFTKLTRVRFVECVLTDTDFLGATLHEVEFDNCHLERTEFDQCKMKDVDLRSSELLEIKGWQSLKGATIDHPQLMAIAPYLANAIGIIVGDD